MSLEHFSGPPWEPLGTERQEGLQEKQEVLSPGDLLGAIKIFLHEEKDSGQFFRNVSGVGGQSVA